MKLNQVLSVFSFRSVSRHATGSWKRQSGLKVGPLVLTVVAIQSPRGLDVDRTTVHCERRFHDGLAEGRVGMDVAPHLPGVALEQLGQGRLGDELGGIWPDDVGAE